MIIQQATDLGTDAIANLKKYNAFMGISILHRFFSRKTMTYYFEWLSSQFKDVVILLMDDPDEYNFKVFKSLDSKEALEKARIISDEIKRGFERILTQKKFTTIKIVQFRDFKEKQEYVTILNTVKKSVLEHPLFKEDLFKLMTTSIGGKIEEFIQQQQLNEDQYNSMKEILSNYIIEELSSVIYFTENNYPIEIDPTIELSTKKLLYEHHFPELFKELKLSQRGHIFVHPQGIEKSTY